jgi:hypothetical protein
MKRIHFLFLFSFAVVLRLVIVVGCASQKPVIESTAPKTEATEASPAWVMKTPAAVDTLFAVGVATEHASIPIARKNAANNARVEMAQIIETKVKALFDGFMKEQADLLDPNAPATSEEFSRTVTRLATDATLVGSQITEYFWDKTNKLYYALATVPRNSLASEIKRQTEALAKDQKSAFADEKMDEAQKRLDDALKNWDVSQ